MRVRQWLAVCDVAG